MKSNSELRHAMTVQSRNTLQSIHGVILQNFDGTNTVLPPNETELIIAAINVVVEALDDIARAQAISMEPKPPRVRANKRKDKLQ